MELFGHEPPEILSWRKALRVFLFLLNQIPYFSHLFLCKEK